MTTPSPELAALLVRIGDLTGRAVRPTTLRAELTRAAASVRQLLDGATCSIALVQPDGETLRFVAADGAGADAITGVTMPVGRGIAGWVVMAGEGIAIGDVQRDTRWASDVGAATSYVPTAILAVPMVDEDGESIGVIEVLDPQLGGDDTGRALDVLGAVGDQVSSIVRLTQIYDRLGAHLLEALADAADVDGFGSALRELASGEDDLGLGELAATFHDLAGQGPEAAALARRILEEVAVFTRRRR